MWKAQQVLNEMKKRKRVDTRKGRKRNLAKKTFRDLMRSTASVRASQNPVGKVEFASVKAVPRNKQLIFKFETRAKTKGRAKYPQTIIFNKIQFSEEQTQETPLRVSIPNGGFIFASKIKADENPVSVRCTCFTGDTKVALADGSVVPIKDLVGREDFYVYSYDEKTGQRVIAKACNAKVYDEEAKLVAVTLDNGHVIRCTPDHVFLLNDGSTKQAQDLKPTDSLRALYRRMSEKGIDGARMDGYEQYLQDGKWLYTHHASDQYNLRHCIQTHIRDITSNFARHPINLNKTDNNPNNIVRMDNKSHIAYHGKTINIGGNPMSDPDVAKKMAATKRKNGEYVGSGYRFNAKDPEVRAKMSKAAQRRALRDDHPLKNIAYDDKYAVKACREGTHHTQKPEWAPAKTKTIEWVNSLPIGTHKVDKSVAEHVGYKHCYHLTNTLKRIQSELGNYTLSVQQGYPTLIHINDGTANHKVAKVEHLVEKEPVYCITVPEFGNFAIVADDANVSSCVYVKNCEDYYYMWWYHDNVNKAHAGPKMPPYVRKTPLPPARGAYPVRNPDEAPGLCKHLIACFKYLQSNKIMTR